MNKQPYLGLPFKGLCFTTYRRIMNQRLSLACREGKDDQVKNGGVA